MATDKRNRENYLDDKSTGAFFGFAAAIGTVIGGWSLLTLTAGFSSVDWQLSEVGRQFLVAIGSLQENETLRDYCSFIKGIEYLVAAAVIAVLPLCFKSLNKEKSAVASR